MGANLFSIKRNTPSQFIPVAVRSAPQVTRTREEEREAIRQFTNWRPDTVSLILVIAGTLTQAVRYVDTAFRTQFPTATPFIIKQVDQLACFEYGTTVLVGSWEQRADW